MFKKYAAFFLPFLLMVVFAACENTQTVDEPVTSKEYVEDITPVTSDEPENLLLQTQPVDFRGKWQGYHFRMQEMIFDVHENEVLMSLPDFGTFFSQVNFFIEEDKLTIYFNDEYFRVVIVLERNQNCLSGSFTQFGRSNDVHFNLLSETPESGNFFLTQGRRFFERLAELREYPYFLEDDTEIAFTYDLNRRDLYMDLIEEFGLDEITAGHEDIALMRVLLDWVKDNFRWNGASGMPDDRDAKSIIGYLQENPGGGNCRLLAILLAELLRLYGIPAKHVTAWPPEDDHPVHVVTHAFSRELNQWVMLDPTFRLYLQDEDGNFMNLYTLRQAFMNETPLIANQNAGINNNPFSMVEFKNFMADYLFRFSTGTYFTFGSEESSPGYRYMLVPAGFRPTRIGIDRFTTSAEAFFALPN